MKSYLTPEQIKARKDRMGNISLMNEQKMSAGAMSDALNGLFKQVARKCGVTNCTSYANGINCTRCSVGKKLMFGANKR